MKLKIGRSLWFQRKPQWFAHGGAMWGERLVFRHWFIGYEFDDCGWDSYFPESMRRRWFRKITQ